MLRAIRAALRSLAPHRRRPKWRIEYDLAPMALDEAEMWGGPGEMTGRQGYDPR